jgi:CheY-like chemotaxis protein
MPSTAVATSPILVVEDHADTRDMVTTLLSAEGYTVVGAENGLRGLEQLRALRPCLILLDLSMPILDGWEFRRVQLSQDSLAEIPVVLLTAIHDPERAMRELKADGLIPKPVDFDRLISSVKTLCGPPH